MPKQNSIIPLSGRSGDWVFYYKKDKRGRKEYYVRRAPENVRQTTATKRTATDFGTASKASRLVRQALKPYTDQYKDESLHYRLNTLLGQILRMDTESPAGRKRLLPENMSLLTGFRFNSDTRIPKMHVEINESGINVLNGNKDMTAKVIALSVNFREGTTRILSGEAMIIKEGTTIPFERNNDLTLLLLETENGRALDIIGVLQPATIPSQTSIRPKLQVQPKSMVKPGILRPYVYPYKGIKHRFTSRSALKRSPFLSPSAPLSPSSGLSPSNPGK